VDNETKIIVSEDAENKYLTFFCDKQLFGVSIDHIVQIVGMQKISPIPEAPEYEKGVINLRGSIIPVIDTRLRLKKEEKEYDERTCIIISTIGEATTGFIVDGVDEVVSIEEESITPHQNMQSGDGNEYITGIANIGGKIVLVMDIEKLFRGTELKNTGEQENDEV